MWVTCVLCASETADSTLPGGGSETAAGTWRLNQSETILCIIYFVHYIPRSLQCTAVYSCLYGSLRGLTTGRHGRVVSCYCGKGPVPCPPPT